MMAASPEELIAQALLNNPSNQVATAPERTRIPMSVPRQKLQVPDIPGYHTHWMLGTPQRLAQAQAGGYTFVDNDEIQALGFGFADSPEVSGSTDLGSRVSVVAGNETDTSHQAVRLYLMKIKQEWWDEDQAALAARNDSVMETIRGGNINTGTHDASGRYGKPENRNILRPLTPGRR